MHRKLVLVGGGGHGQSVIDVIEAEGIWTIAGILDMPKKIGERVLGYEIMDTEQAIPLLATENAFLITVGQVRTSQPRERLFQIVRQAEGKLPVIVSPQAYVSPYATLGEGSVVIHQALVNAGAIIGVNAIINSQALIEHGARIGNHCHIATGAIINGDCRVEDRTFVGSRATVLQGVTIGTDIVVGAGAVVTQSLTEPGVYVGIPARRKGRRGRKGKG